MLHIPLLRRGKPYKSLDVSRASHHATGKPFAEISQANVGLIRRDLLAQEAMRAALVAMPTARRLELSRDAAAILLNVTLRLGGEIAADPYAQCHATGAFILVDESTHDTVAAGMVS